MIVIIKIIVVKCLYIIMYKLYNYGYLNFLRIDHYYVFL